MQWHRPIVRATWEAAAEGLFELGVWAAVCSADQVSTLSWVSLWRPRGSGRPPGCLTKGEPAQVEKWAG